MLDPKDQLTVVHCDDEDRAAELADLLQNWAEAGLILADLWVVSGVDPDEWNVRPVALVDSYHFAVTGRSGRDQLGEAVAAREYRLFRLVHLTFADSGAEPAASPDGLSSWEAITSFMRGRLRLNVAKLQLVNVIIPTSARTRDLSSGLLQPAANLNLIAAPEDSRSSRIAWLPFSNESSSGPRETSGWGATVAAAAAGLWTGVEENPLDGGFEPLIEGEPAVAVGRAFVRVLDGGFLVDHIGAGLIGRFDEWPYPADLDRPDDLLMARGSGLEDIASAFIHVDDGALRFDRLPRKAKPAQEEIGWWQALLMMFRFMADAIRQAPTSFVQGFVDRAKLRAANWTQKVVFGSDSAFLVTFGGRTAGGGYEGDPPQTTMDVRATAERVFSLLDDRNPPPASPATWRALRQLVLSLGDGGDLPAVGQPPLPELARQGSNHLLVRSPDRLAPDPAAVTLALQEELFRPGEPLAAWDPVALRPCDPLTCMQMLEALSRAEAEMGDVGLAPQMPPGPPTTGIPAATDTYAADVPLDPGKEATGGSESGPGEPPSSTANAIPEDVGGDAPSQGPVDEDEAPGGDVVEVAPVIGTDDRVETDPAAGPSGEAEPGEVGGATPAGDTRGPSAQPPLDPAAQRRNMLTQAQAAIREFAGRQRRSLMWLIGENITAELFDAIREYQRAIGIVKEGRPDLDETEAKAAKKRLGRRWLLIAALAVLFLLGGWLVLSITLVILAPLAVVGMLAGWSIPFLRYHQEMFRIQYRQFDDQDRYEHAEASARKSSYEILKLIDRYTEFLDWSEILGGFVHRPWGQPAKLTPSTVDMELAGVPRSFTVARGYVKEERVKSLRARALRDIIRSRWLNNQFDKVVEGVLDDFAESRGLRRDRDVVEPEEDTRRGDVSSREAVRSAILRGVYSEQARVEMEHQVNDFCARLTPSEIFEFARVELRPDEVPAKVSAKGRALQPTDTGIRLSPLTNPATTGQLDVREVVRAVLPSVVHIVVPDGNRASIGSGVVLTRDGYIVTNAHVVGPAGSVIVEFTDGKVLSGEVVMTKPDEDLAVVHVEHKALTPARRQRTELLQVGEAVLAVGNPAGLKGGPSVTLGIVSALNRTAEFEDHTLTGMVQTDAAISPGSSGGGLFDANGEFVGIPTAGRMDAQNIGYAIAVQRAMALIGSVVGNSADEVEDLVAAQETPAEIARPQGMAYTDMDVFFAELSPDENEEFGRGSCWPEANERLGTPARSIVWSPGVVPEITGPNVEQASLRPPITLGRKLVYATCRLDLTRAVDARSLVLFPGESTMLPETPLVSDGESPADDGPGGLL